MLFFCSGCLYQIEQLIFLTKLHVLFFEQLMGIEIPSEYNGTGCNFLTTICIVEELSKVDPSVGAFVDIHNTLVNSIMIKLGNEEQKKKYLPLLANNWVKWYLISIKNAINFVFTASQFLSDGIVFWKRCVFFENNREERRRTFSYKRFQNVDFKLRHRSNVSSNG